MRPASAKDSTERTQRVVESRPAFVGVDTALVCTQSQGGSPLIRWLARLLLGAGLILLFLTPKPGLWLIGLGLLVASTEETHDR